ncbi:hypothetical protein DSO57_1028002 [Entomophthora muscae]|uniref:Uncharacterized protein n=1 Tax=Entomophthora muscae TaxID=34485 RepID=A0ACC2TP36_9FUNG|nr:hypothetical protein DSO57_1028002 [Entomophthora muscae]
MINQEAQQVFEKHKNLLWKINYKSDALLDRHSNNLKENIYHAFRLETNCPLVWNTHDMHNRTKYMKMVLFWPFCNQLSSSGRDLFAKVVAYYDFACLRFCDTVAMSTRYCHLIPSSIEEYLVQELDVVSADCEPDFGLASEDPAVAAKRSALELKLFQLQRLQDSIFAA